MNLEFRISFVPKWRSIELFRRGLETLLEAGIEDPDKKASIAMVSAELLENAYKHGSQDTAPINYAIEIEDNVGHVTVVNHVVPELDSNIDKLLSTAECITGFDNQLNAYIEKMKDIYAEGETETSGLGLVRIVYEGQCKLECTVERTTRRVEVKATFLGLEGK